MTSTQINVQNYRTKRTRTNLTTKIAGLWGCPLSAASSLKIFFLCSYLPKYIKVIDKTICGNVICKWWPCGILTKNLASFLLIKLKSLSTRTDQAGSPKGSGTVESFLYLCYVILVLVLIYFGPIEGNGINYGNTGCGVFKRGVQN